MFRTSTPIPREMLISQIDCAQLLVSLAFAHSALANPNGIISDDSNTALAKVKMAEIDNVTILEPRAPRMIAWPASAILVQSGEALHLTCEAKASPEVAISWFFNGSPAVTGDKGWLAGIGSAARLLNQGLVTLETSFTKSILSIPCLGQENSGRYSCVAENRLGIASKYFSVSVDASSSEDMECAGEAKPTSTTWTTGRFENTGAAMQLQCRLATGSHQVAPAPKWSKMVDDSNGVEEWSLVANLESYGNDLEVMPDSNDLLVKGHACPTTCLFACEDGTRRYKSFVYSTAFP